MSDLTDALNRIVNWLKNHTSEKYASVDVWQPGLSYEEIDRRVADLPFKLPEEIYELYQWRNGTYEGEEDFSRFFSGYAFLSLESAIKEYEELNWKLHWFPIFYLDSRDYFIISCQSEDLALILRIYLGGGEGEQVLFSSLTNMMLTIAECYETGAFYFDDEGYLTSSYSKQEFIRKKYNPETRNFWGGW
ncbi:MAG: SMI1/KNR4 family protein [Rivularia sp. (in: Bacteria)]|nr:SMI1/KNR4 family protein [Rivularia sp. MS3]